VTWADAVEFCKKLGDRKEERAAKRVYRLPTEAEWEYACRAGTRTPFHTGAMIDSSQANFDGRFPHPYATAPQGPWRKQTIPVGNFKPNAWGLYDMHGNVAEWVQRPLWGRLVRAQSPA